MMLKGDLLYAMGRYGDAADSYRRAAENKVRHSGRAWLMAGYAALQINDLNASRQAFKRAADDPQQKRAALDALKKIK
jgi:Tfp pilus assembly protein PilF